MQLLDYVPPAPGFVGNAVELLQLSLVIATSSIAISPVNEDPAIPSKIIYKWSTKQWEVFKHLEKVKQVGSRQGETVVK